MPHVKAHPSHPSLSPPRLLSCTAAECGRIAIIGQLIASILYVIANIYVGRDHFILCRLVLEDYAVCS